MSIDHILQLASHYPDLVAILAGSSAGYAFSLLAEAYWIPETMSRRAQQGTTVIIAMVSATTLSFVIWGQIDPEDKAPLKAAGSLVGAILGVFLYPACARLATKYFPVIGSVWSLPGDKP